MEYGRAAMATTKAPYGDVPYGDPGYLDADGNQASKSGKPGVKRYPLDAEHVEAAWSYINQAKNAGQYTAEQLSAIRGRIKSAMAKHGHDVSDDSSSSSSGRAESLAPFVRNFALRDVSVKSSREGKIVEAYAAVFDTPALIHDQDGEYYEEIDRTAFNKAIADARPVAGSRRTNWNVGVFYNHGMTILGTPSERASMPVGVPLDISADSTGVLTVTQYHRSEFAEEIVEGLESGAIPGYSFSGMFRRSSPLIPRGGFRRNVKTGDYPTVRRMESTLREYGPTPRPAYKEAAVVGMRAEQMLAAMSADPELAMRMISMLSAGTPQEPPSETCTPSDGEPQPRSRIVVHSGRSAKEEMQARRSAFLQRQYRR